MDDTKSVQRSFRLSRKTADALDAAAAAGNETRNALADRLLGEALRIERHPLIRFRTGPAGWREPMLVGTRLKVRQVMHTLRGEDNDLDAAAAYFSLPRSTVAAALAYYAEYANEVDADEARAHAFERAERARWDRQQAAVS